MAVVSQVVTPEVVTTRRPTGALFRSSLRLRRTQIGFGLVLLIGPRRGSGILVSIGLPVLPFSLLLAPSTLPPAVSAPPGRGLLAASLAPCAPED